VGSVVAVLDRPSARMVSTFLGILRAGAAYLALDPANPADRNRFMLDDSGASLVLVAPKLASLVAGAALTEDLDELASALERQPAATGAPGAGHDALTPAYLMYTSGSTGQPKGTVVPHRAIVRLVVNTDYVDLRASDVVAQVSNASFDAATFEIWGALLNGACLVGIDKEVLLSTADLARELVRHGVTVMFITTALFHLHAQAQPSAFRGLRYLLTGGEVIDPQTMRRVLEAAPPDHLLNVYGPTETTTFATAFPVTHVASGTASLPIGKPIANTTAYVLDDDLRLCPPGKRGELFIGGDGVALGYVNRPELTAARFVSDPFRAGARLYRTGDLARYRPDGNIDFLGRADAQVKVRGYRVELGEIEAVLRRHRAVSQAVVVAVDEPQGRRLAAFVVMDDEDQVDRLRSFVSRTLPDYMIPSAFVPLAGLPLNPNGKVDRTELPKLPASGMSTSGPGAQFHSGHEGFAAVAGRLWAEVLGFERDSTCDGFLALGGDSLAATRLVARLRETLGLEVPIRTLFEADSFRAWVDRVLLDALEAADDDVLADLLDGLGDGCAEAQDGDRAA
jgi:amino acid adenylation domain-containing protein